MLGASTTLENRAFDSQVNCGLFAPAKSSAALFFTRVISLARPTELAAAAAAVDAEELQALNFQTVEVLNHEGPAAAAALPEPWAAPAKPHGSSGSPLLATDGRRISSRARSAASIGSEGVAGGVSPR